LEARLGRQPDEGVAPETLAALHGLEQIRPGLIGELEVDGERGIEISESLEHQRNPIEPVGSELPELRFGHELLQILWTRERRRTLGGKGAPGAPGAGGKPLQPSGRQNVHDCADWISEEASTRSVTIASASRSRTSPSPV